MRVIARLTSTICMLVCAQAMIVIHGLVPQKELVRSKFGKLARWCGFADSRFRTPLSRIYPQNSQYSPL
jgi:hypothetical protein